MLRSIAQLSSFIGVLMFGLLIGSWLGSGSSLLWWLIIGLGFLIVVLGVTGTIYRTRQHVRTS